MAGRADSKLQRRRVPSVKRRTMPPQCGRRESAMGSNTEFDGALSRRLDVKTCNALAHPGRQAQGVALNDDGKIQSLIKTIRGVQVILDRDVSRLYGVATGALNRQVKRNEERFPEDLMFRLSAEEWDNLKCQIGISSWGGDRQLPYAFTENGIAMLSSVLRSPTAIEVNIRIMRAFSAMRRFLLANAQMFQRIEAVEKRQIATDAKVDSILQRIDAAETPLRGVFYDEQLWDARALVLKLVAGAKRSLILIDNWANTEVLDLFAKKRKGVKVTIFTSEHYDKNHVPHHKISDVDVKTFNAQYPRLAVRYNESFHDRFLIIDDKELYLIGASLKDLGRKCFAFTKLDAGEIRRIKKTAFGCGKCACCSRDIPRAEALEAEIRAMD